ncbi:MAG: N-acetyltransferase [Rhodocyclaceae bacterium]|nr:MAG: N-acetyltransferase [Rhodocyclaceae bacterium]
MSETPQITTRRLTIVPFTERFLTPQYVGWLNDPEVVRFSTQRRRVHTLESCRDYWQSYFGTPHRFWAIVEHERNLGHIGNMNAYIDPHDQVADIGILIGNKAAWRLGYGLEAWRALCGYLFGSEVVRKISAGCLAANLPMASIMSRAGMVPDGVRAGHSLFEGKPMDIIHAALFKEDWQA